VAPSLAAPGDSDLSDATDSTSSLIKLTTATAGGSGAGELRRWPAVRVSDGQQKCADRMTLIRISPRTLIKDLRVQSTAISCLDSLVIPCLNVSLYT